MWPSVGNKQGWNAKIAPLEPIYDARKGEPPRRVGTLDVNNRRTMEAEITTRAVDFIKRNAAAKKPFFAYVSFSLMHMPTLPNPDFAGRTGNGDWADCLAEMDYRASQILDAIKQAGIEDNTLVIFTSDNGPEGTNPWQAEQKCQTIGPLMEPISWTFSSEKGDLQPRRISRLRRRPTDRGQMA